MGTPKVYHKTDISIPEVKDSRNIFGQITEPSKTIAAISTSVAFGSNATAYRTFDFAQWYRIGIDQITEACQRQIERFLAGQDIEVEASSVATYCRGGLKDFLNYLALSVTVLKRDMTLDDIDRSVIDGFLAHLNRLGLSKATQKNRYNNMKTVLGTLGKRGFASLTAAGDSATFPRNPFPNSNSKGGGEKPLSIRQRDEFAKAIKHAVLPIWSNGVQISSKLLTCALLIVALHTGRNTTSLLEMERDCLRAHPKENLCFLVLWKRRGHNTNKIVLRTEGPVDQLVESNPIVKTNVERLIRRVLALSESLREEAPENLQNRVWLLRPTTGTTAGQVGNMSNNMLERAFKTIVKDYDLTEPDGKPLRVNISRLRKTFANRIFELLDSDLATTAIALGNTPKVAAQHYLTPSDDARRNWKFMGEILVNELLDHTIGATYHKTPMGGCSDPVNGQYAPKRDGAVCFSFLNCLRCKHYAVTGDDLYKLYSFYFRVLAERNHMDRKRWAQEYAHIPRLIDEYIVAEGIRRGIFRQTVVKDAREQARRAPHPFWSTELLETLEVFT
jgi:hypothetical protein